MIDLERPVDSTPPRGSPDRPVDDRLILVRLGGLAVHLDAIGRRGP